MKNTNGRYAWTLRPDTTVAPDGSPDEESYVHELPACCLRALKTSFAGRGEPDRRLLSFECECGRSWRITSSLDSRVLERFVLHGGPRTGGSSPAA